MNALLSLNKLPLPLREKGLKLAPSILRPILKITPFSTQKSILLPALHSVFNEAVEDGDFEFLEGKWLKINIQDLNLSWWLSYESNRLVMGSEAQLIKEDVCFSANGDDLVLIAGRKEDPDTLFFQRRLKIEGNTELGLEVKNLIDAIDIEQLPSKVHSFVDVIATLLSNTKSESLNLK